MFKRNALVREFAVTVEPRQRFEDGYFNQRHPLKNLTIKHLMTLGLLSKASEKVGIWPGEYPLTVLFGVHKVSALGHYELKILSCQPHYAE